MLTVIVRGRKDAAAVEAMAERFYPDWNLKVATLHGARTPDRALEELSEILSKPGYYLLLLGREDGKLACSIGGKLPATAVVHVVPRARVRNARLEMLALELARARAKLRVSIGWDGGKRAYIISSPKPFHKICIYLLERLYLTTQKDVNDEFKSGILPETIWLLCAKSL